MSCASASATRFAGVKRSSPYRIMLWLQSSISTVARLVRDFESEFRLILTHAAAAALPALAFGVEIGRRRDVAFLAHPLDDLLDQFLELRPHFLLVAVGGIAQQLFDGLVWQHAAV